jgi:hypothetical protein
MAKSRPDFLHGVVKSLEKFQSWGVVCDDELRDEDSAYERAYFVVSVGGFRCEAGRGEWK